MSLLNSGEQRYIKAISKRKVAFIVFTKLECMLFFIVASHINLCFRYMLFFCFICVYYGMTDSTFSHAIFFFSHVGDSLRSDVFNLKDIFVMDH